MKVLDEWRRVDGWVLEPDPDGRASADGTPPEDLVRAFHARRIAQGGPLRVSPWQFGYLTAELGVHGTGKDRDPALAAHLAAAWHWWAEHVRGRIWEPPAVGLFEPSPTPPMQAPPRVVPQPAAGGWVDGVQQHSWWVAARRTVGGHAARRNAAQWAAVRDAAASVARSEVSQVLTLIDRTSELAKLWQPQTTPAAPSRIGKW